MKAALRTLTLAMLLALCAAIPGREADAEQALRVGDVLRIDLPGEAEFNKDFPIDRKSKVTLPEAGAVGVAGRSLEDATAAMHGALSHAFRDLEKLSVSLKERKLFISVLG